MMIFEKTFFDVLFCCISEGNFNNIINALNIITYTFAVSELMPAVYLDMRNKENVRTSVWGSHIICFVIYLLVAVTAFVAYGNHAAKADQVTLLFDNKGAKLTVAIALIVHTIVDLPFWLHPVGIFVENFFFQWFEKTLFIQVLARTIVVLSMVGVALIGDQVTPLQAVSGSFTASVTCMILPNVFYLVLAKKYEDKNGDQSDAVLSTSVSRQIEDVERPEDEPTDFANVATQSAVQARKIQNNTGNSTLRS